MYEREPQRMGGLRPRTHTHLHTRSPSKKRSARLHHTSVHTLVQTVVSTSTGEARERLSTATILTEMERERIKKGRTDEEKEQETKL